MGPIVSFLLSCLYKEKKGKEEEKNVYLEIPTLSTTPLPAQRTHVTGTADQEPLRFGRHNHSLTGALQPRVGFIQRP